MELGAAAMAEGHAPKTPSPRLSPKSAATFQAAVQRRQSSIMFELRVIEHEQLVSRDKENKKAVLSQLIRSKRRRHESHEEAVGAASSQESQEATLSFDRQESCTSGDITVTLHRHQRGSCDAMFDETPKGPEDIQQLKEKRIVESVRERFLQPSRTNMVQPDSGAPPAPRAYAEDLQSLRQSRSVSSILQQGHLVQAFERSIASNAQRTAARAPPTRAHPPVPSARPRPPVPAPRPGRGSTARRAGRAGDMPVDVELARSSVEQDIAALTRNEPVARVLNGEFRQVLEIHIRHRLRRAGVTATEVILQQARARPAPSASASARVTDVSVLQAQIRILAEQMAEMSRMVAATYNLQLDMQRTLNQQVSAALLRSTAADLPPQPPAQRPSTARPRPTPVSAPNPVLGPSHPFAAPLYPPAPAPGPTSAVDQSDHTQSHTQHCASTMGETQPTAETLEHSFHAAAFDATAFEGALLADSSVQGPSQPLLSSAPLLHHTSQPEFVFQARHASPPHDHDHKEVCAQQASPHTVASGVLDAVLIPSAASSSDPDHGLAEMMQGEGDPYPLECVICSNAVDSVLYRCGHMCVCNLCARHLKVGNQCCPLCRAPIDDIVRVYSA